MIQIGEVVADILDWSRDEGWWLIDNGGSSWTMKVTSSKDFISINQESNDKDDEDSKFTISFFREEIPCLIKILYDEYKR